MHAFRAYVYVYVYEYETGEAKKKKKKKRRMKERRDMVVRASKVKEETNVADGRRNTTV